MRIVRGVLAVSTLLAGAVVALGGAAGIVDRAGAVPFDADETEPVDTTRRWSLPFEDQAA